MEPMTTDIKLIMLDLDKTLLNGNGAISQVNREALSEAEQRGILVTLASGRSFSSMLPFAQELGTRLPLIASNGAWIRNPRPPQETLAHNTLSEPVARQTVELLRREAIHINLYIEDLLIVEDADRHVQEYSRIRGMPYEVVTSFDDVTPLCPTKILAIDIETQRVRSLKEELLTDLNAEIFCSSPYFCEILPPGINKGWALEYLCGYLDIPPLGVMAFGDEENDIEMIKKAGIGVAMGNALKTVQTVADAITSPHDEDGVALYLNQFLKNKAP